MARILTSYYKPTPGGLCKRYFRAINVLLARGHTVHYVAVEKFPIEHENCHFHRFPWPKQFVDNYFFWAVFHLCAPFQFLYIVLRRRIDCAFYFNLTYALLMQPARFFLRLSISLFLRADGVLNHEIKGRPRWLCGLEKILEGFAINGTQLIGVSETLTHSVIARHNWSRPVSHGTLPNDIESAPDTWRKFSGGAMPLRFACVGILEPRKNQVLILHSIAALKDLQFKLHIFGTGPQAKALQELTKRLSVTEKVNFQGWCERDTMWSNIDVLLFPSLHEGVSNTVLEAIQRGVPVLASDIPEHREILPAEYLIPLDQDSWTEAINKIANDYADWGKSISDAQQNFAGKLHFDWDEEICRLIVAGR